MILTCIVSGSAKLSDNMKELVRGYVTEKVTYFESEYQPDDH
jgi:hypothetical protein